MVMKKRWMIRKETDIKEFAKACKACKDFTPEKQKEMVKFIFALKLDRFIATGVKRKLARKKVIKREIALYKEDLAFRMLDMMEEKWVDMSEEDLKHDWEKSKAAFDAIEKIAVDPSILDDKLPDNHDKDKDREET